MRAVGVPSSFYDNIGFAQRVEYFPVSVLPSLAGHRIAMSLEGLLKDWRMGLEELDLFGRLQGRRFARQGAVLESCAFADKISEIVFTNVAEHFLKSGNKGFAFILRDAFEHGVACAGHVRPQAVVCLVTCLG